MSYDTDSAGAAAPDAPPQPVAAGPVPILQFLQANFVALSGLAVVGGIALAVIFLSTYLSMFDWHLLWFVQYTDIVTFGLIALGILGGSIILLQSMAQVLLSAGSLDGWSRTRWLATAAIIFLLLLGFEIYGTIRGGHEYYHVLFGAGAIISGVILILMLVSHLRNAQWPSLGQMMGIMIIAVSSTVGFGQWLAYSVLETSQFDQDVYLKSETLNDMKLIIVMSRHTILLKDKVLYVVPTADIAKFQTAGKR